MWGSFFVIFTMENSSKIREILVKFIPEPAWTYSLMLWESEPFHFKISKSRKTKLGDFRFRKDRKIQTITINGDLNPFQFLLTYIHEVAHLHTFVRYGYQIPPHGQEWKSSFRNLMAPILSDRYFPKDLLIPLRKHMLNPKASSSRDLFLMREMGKYDKEIIGDREVFLADLRLGSFFNLGERKFQKGPTKRTRSVCIDIDNQKKYMVSLLAKVTPHD